MPGLWVLPTIAVLSSIPCRGEPQVPAVPDSSDVIAGPATAPLGSVAEIKVPSGYKFMGPEGTRARLAQTENVVPKDLLGMLVSDTGNWTMLFDYKDLGHMKDVAVAQMSPERVLKGLASQFKQQHPADAKTSLAWQLEPRYDAAAHALEAVMRVTSAKPNSEPVLNYSVDFLGRHGTLHATVIYRGFTDLETLKQLASSVSFIEGERYGDYQEGDKLCSLDVAGLLTYAPSPEPAPSTLALLKANALWIGVAFGALMVAGGGGILLAARLRRRSPQRERHIEHRPALAPSNTVAAAQPLAAASVAMPAEATAVVAPSAVPAFKPKAQPSHIHPKVPLSPRPALNRRDSSQRRKMFDYNRYFTDLMSTVSHYATAADSQRLNGTSLDAAKPASAGSAAVNGNGNGSGNGNGHAHTANGLFQANSELIANQTSFINEQRRLMQEQSRLIEEKSKLIAEKNQLLKMQSEYIEQKLL